MLFEDAQIAPENLMRATPQEECDCAGALCSDQAAPYEEWLHFVIPISFLEDDGLCYLF
jgi:hypothetical protein